VFLTGIGSSYYHWDPNDGRLFWDRLPMGLSFVAIFALAVEERVSTRAGAILLWPSLAVSLLSLLLWRWTGDLRLYFWVQFFPGLAVLWLFFAYPPKYTGTYYWIVAGSLYAIAKVFEFTDQKIFSVGYFLSGHTLKHLAAAAACFAMLRYFQTRRLIQCKISDGARSSNYGTKPGFRARFSKVAAQPRALPPRANERAGSGGASSRPASRKDHS
jgi:hypothetical protein